MTTHPNTSNITFTFHCNAEEKSTQFIDKDLDKKDTSLINVALKQAKELIGNGHKVQSISSSFLYTKVFSGNHEANQLSYRFRINEEHVKEVALEMEQNYQRPRNPENAPKERIIIYGLKTKVCGPPNQVSRNMEARDRQGKALSLSTIKIILAEMYTTSTWHNQLIEFMYEYDPD